MAFKRNAHCISNRRIVEASTLSLESLIEDGYDAVDERLSNLNPESYWLWVEEQQEMEQYNITLTYDA